MGKERVSSSPKGEEVVISFRIPKTLLNGIDELVEMGIFNNRSQAIRTAIFLFLKENPRLRVRLLEPEVGYR